MIGSNLKRIREKKRLTQKQLAEQLGGFPSGDLPVGSRKARD